MPINLNDLHRNVKRLDGLLSDRQMGLLTWNMMLEQSLSDLASVLASKWFMDVVKQKLHDKSKP